MNCSSILEIYEVAFWDAFKKACKGTSARFQFYKLEIWQEVLVPKRGFGDKTTDSDAVMIRKMSFLVLAKNFQNIYK